jgi:hypothetical protein
MNKSKSELAYLVLEYCDLLEKSTREAACPCCDNGISLTGPCQECHGKGLVCVAYDSLRIHQKLQREKLAGIMISHSFATGHGDTIEDLLKELDWQLSRMREMR